MDLSKLKYNDFLWLSIACIAGTLMWSLPSILNAEGKDGGIFFIIVTLALLLTGTTFGYLKLQRPWRWALASVLFLPIIELIAIVAATKEAASSLLLAQSLPYLLVKVPIYALQGLPMLIGAYLGAYIKKRPAKEESDSISKRQNRIWWLGFMLGFLSGVPYIATPIQTSTFPVFILPLAIIILFLSAMGICFYLPQKARRWAIAVAIGLPAAVICKIIIDSTQDSSSHNLFPIEIFISLVISIPSTFVGAKIGLSLNRYSKD